MTVNEIRERLSEVRAAGVRGNIVEAGLVQEIKMDGPKIVVRFVPTGIPGQLLNGVVADIQKVVRALPGVSTVDVDVIPPAATPRPNAYGDLGPVAGIRHIVAVSSTKGGVGKSTVAVNLACAFTKLGKKVGIMDADVYGPSLPTMVAASGRPRVDGEQKVHPIEKYSMKLMSMGFLIDDNTPVIWRGPLVTGLVRQFLKDVEWGELDVLVIDLPPGTGDAQLTLLQQVPLAGGVIVTTPQAVSTIDVERGIAMFQKVNAPVLGVVENMSFFHCPKCGTDDDLFGSGGGESIAAQFGIPVLAKIPLFPEIRAGGDAGMPIVLDQPTHPASKQFLEVASQVLDMIESGAMQTPAPKIIG